MAKPQSTSGARARKNRRTDPPSGAPAGDPGDPLFSLVPAEDPEVATPDRGGLSLEQVIETERGRLSHAQSILGCLHAALLNAEQRNRHEPGCADVAAIAQTLVREATHRLDYIYLRPFIEGLRTARPVPGRRRSASARR